MRHKAILMDVDGTLTDGKKYYFNDSIAKSFSVIDGQGIELAHENRIICGIITADTQWNEIYDRAKDLHIDKDNVYMTGSKIDAAQDFCIRHNITIDEVCYIGDDIKDIPLLQIVGLPACPGNAISAVSDYIRKKYGFISVYSGGSGAVRDTIEHMIVNTK